MVWKCQNPACGYENEDSEDYCIKCGLKKGSGVMPSAPAPSPQPSQGPLAESVQELQPVQEIQAPEAKLVLVKSSVPLTNEFSVTNGKSIGRAIENDIVLPDAYVSRKHAKISFENGVYVIEDLNSTNGTFVNGNDVKGKGKQPLKDGDELRFGTTVFKFRQL
jgi:hypothetical protein